MIRRTFDRYGYWVAVGALAAAIGLMLGVMVVNIAVPELQSAGVVAVTSTPVPSAAPTASPVTEMDGAVIPGNAECSGCHLTTSGTIGLRPMPVMGHPLEGWSECTNCHALGRLVDTAPGHTGIHATECTICHKSGSLPAPLSRPHRETQNLACLSCHGSIAPLPADMTHRKEAACWLCHRVPTTEPPVPAHQTAPGEADCRTCHVAGGKAGKLPADHVDRTAKQCLACHEVTLGTTPDTSPGIVTWPSASISPAPLATPLVPLAP
jgi:hypothetical protein